MNILGALYSSLIMNTKIRELKRAPKMGCYFTNFYSNKNKCKRSHIYISITYICPIISFLALQIGLDKGPQPFYSRSSVCPFRLRLKNQFSFSFYISSIVPQTYMYLLWFYSIMANPQNKSFYRHRRI